MSEMFDIVDENNQIVGQATRKECHEKGLLHRAVHIFVINSKKQFLLQKRSMTKDLYKGMWGDTAGHLDVGESYEHGAKRETKEEIGIDSEPEFLFEMKKDFNPKDKEFLHVFLVRSEGPFTIDENEVEKIQWFTLEEAMKLVKDGKTTPGTRGAFNELAKRPEILNKLGL